MKRFDNDDAFCVGTNCIDEAMPLAEEIAPLLIEVGAETPPPAAKAVAGDKDAPRASRWPLVVIAAALALCASATPFRPPLYDLELISEVRVQTSRRGGVSRA